MKSTQVVATPSGHYVQANGIHMYYEDYGAGEPLILLHGGTETSSMWQPHIPAFADYFRILAPDARGQGRTNNPTDELSYERMADDLAAFIRALGLTKPLLCGWSDGGQIALEIGMRYPGLSTALVVGGAWYKFSDTYTDALRALHFEAPGAVNIAALQAESPEWVEHLKALHGRADDPDRWKAVLGQLSTMFWTPLDYAPDDFKAIAEPTLLLLGDRDGIIELQQAIDLYQLIPNAELAILPNRTHQSTSRPPVQLFTATILDFLLRHKTTPQEAEQKDAT